MSTETRVGVVIAAAGRGRRMGGDKLYMKIAGVPVLAASVLAFENNERVKEIAVSVREGTEGKFRREILEPYGIRKVKTVVPGGAERSLSVRAAVSALSEDCSTVLIHDGARPLVSRQVIDRVIDAAESEGAAVPGVPLKDTVKTVEVSAKGTFVQSTPDRSSLTAVQTPQGFRRSILEDMYSSEESEKGLDLTTATDDASLAELLGYPVSVVSGDNVNLKITLPGDLTGAESLVKDMRKRKDPGLPEIFEEPADDDCSARKEVTEKEMGKGSGMPVFRTGTGYDVHAFAEGRPLILGGVEIPHDRGLEGHSDADVLVHAIMDALLGASALGDIGQHFPDTDMRYKGVSSITLLKHVAGLLRENGYTVVNTDSVIVAQRPKLAGYIYEMRSRIADALEININCVSVKATTTERLGFTGREEGIAAQAAASVVSKQEEILP